MTSICIVAQTVYDADPRVRRKAEALIDAGYTVDVLALRPIDGKKCYSIKGVNVRTISLGKKRRSLTRYFFEYAMFFLWVFARMNLQILRGRYAVIDVNTLPDFLVFAPILAKWLGTKIILDMHEITPEFYMSKFGIVEDSLTVRVLKWVEKISFGFADRVITINEPIEDLLISRGLSRAKSIVVMNVADETLFRDTSTRSVPLVDGNQGKFVMMYHGTLTSLYGLDIAIEGFAIVHKEMPGAEFWILGSGREKDELRQLAEKRGLGGKVKLQGQVPLLDVRSWLSQCDVGILPIRKDIFLDFAFSNKLPEFIILGKAVIVSRLKTIKYYFSEDSLAYTEPNSPSDLGRQMLRLYRNPQLRTQLSLNARKEYTPIRWEIMKLRYLALIEDLILCKGHPAEGSALKFSTK